MVVYMACKLFNDVLFTVPYPEIGHFEMQNRLDTYLFDSQNHVYRNTVYRFGVTQTSVKNSFVSCFAFV